jgi:hypothetical protein
MSKNEMVSKVSNHIIDIVGTLIGHNGQWTSKSRENVFVYKLDNYCSNVGVECSSFHPLCCIISGYQNVPTT